MKVSLKRNTSADLHDYVALDERTYAGYEAYQANIEVINQAAAARPNAHVVIVSRLSCRDCVRNVPRMARIAEHLPGWTWEVVNSETDLERVEALGVMHVPTFIIYEPDGEYELGRIIENPASGWLEEDLLAIVHGAG